MLVGPTVGWTCNGSFGADGSGCWRWRRSGQRATSGTTWHLPPPRRPRRSSPWRAVRARAGCCTGLSASSAPPRRRPSRTSVRAVPASPSQEQVVRISASRSDSRTHQVWRDGYPRVVECSERRHAVPAEGNRGDGIPGDVHAAGGQHDLCTAVLNQFAATFGEYDVRSTRLHAPRRPPDRGGSWELAVGAMLSGGQLTASTLFPSGSRTKAA